MQKTGQQYVVWVVPGFLNIHFYSFLVYRIAMPESHLSIHPSTYALCTQLNQNWGALCAIHHAICWGYSSKQDINGKWSPQPPLELAIRHRGWTFNKPIWKMRSVLRKKGNKILWQHLTMKSNLVWGERGGEWKKSMSWDLTKSFRDRVLVYPVL